MRADSALRSCGKSHILTQCISLNLVEPLRHESARRTRPFLPDFNLSILRPRPCRITGKLDRQYNKRTTRSSRCLYRLDLKTLFVMSVQSIIGATENFITISLPYIFLLEQGSLPDFNCSGPPFPMCVCQVWEQIINFAAIHQIIRDTGRCVHSGK